ncbi:MAG: hypothetical protein IPH75_12435 [bacterium]|nr:hypothetical protein [bacterium]
MKPHGEKNELNPKDIFAVVLRRKWILIVPFIIVSILTYAASYLITPVFQSSTIVAVSPQQRLSTDLQRLLGQEAYRGRTSEESELRSIYNDITSSYYLNQLNERMHLDRDQGLANQVAKVAALHPEIDKNIITLDLLQQELKENVGVRFAAQDHVMITVRSPMPKKAQEIANNLGQIFIAEKKKQEMSSIQTSQDFSGTQFEKYDLTLRQKINERTRYQEQLLQVQMDAGIGSEENRTNLRVDVDRTNSDINDLQREQTKIVAELKTIPGLDVANLALPASTEMDGLKSDLKRQLEDIPAMSLRYPWADPQVLSMNLKQNSALRSIQSLSKRLVDDRWGSLDANSRGVLYRYFENQATLDFSYSRAIYLKAALDQITDKMTSVPQYQATLNRLDQEINDLTTLRNQFKSQQEGSSISQALFQDISSSKYRVVEPAKLAIDPVEPNRIKILLMGLALGLVIGGAATILVELLDTSFKKVADVEEFLGLPVLGIAPKIEYMSKVTE